MGKKPRHDGIVTLLFNPHTLPPAELLGYLRERLTLGDLAEKLNVTQRSVSRWLSGEVEIPRHILFGLSQILSGPSERQVGISDFTTIDLFAGIGGIRAGFEANGAECIFTSEWNTYSKKTYTENYGEHHPFVGDITQIAPHLVPDHDVLLGGFPCQPFSLAGVSKKNSLGRPHGFDDPTQGTLFFNVKEIIAAKRPAAFMLENVKNLLSHDRGRTFKIIKLVLEEELGYQVHYKILDGGAFTPQHRERIIIVGFDGPTSFTWEDFELPAAKPVFRDILHKTDGSEPFLPWDGDRYFDHERNQLPEKYTLTPRLWEYLQNYAAKHRAAGNGFGYGMPSFDGVSRTLSARYHKDGSEILVNQGSDRRPRRLTPRECARLMGFPDNFRIPVSDTQSYRQFGNSVVAPVMAEVARIMKPHILEIKADRQARNRRSA